MKISEKKVILLKSWFSNLDQIVQSDLVKSDLVNYELIVILVLLTLRTSIYEKSMELLEPQLDHTVLRIMAS